MTFAHPPTRRLLILAAIGLVCVGTVVLALWLLAGYAGSHESATAGYRTAQATVLKTASCQGGRANDSISFTLDGRKQQALLNGCGNQAGETMDVLVPPDVNPNTVIDQSAAAPGDSAGLTHRIAFLLLVVATVVGGGCGYLLHRAREASRRLGRPTSHRALPEAVPDPRGRPASPAVEDDPEATSVDWFEDSVTHHGMDFSEPAEKP